LLLVSK